MNSFSESFKRNPIVLDHIIPLDFKNTHKLPESHTWPTAFSACTIDHPSTHPYSIPIIDLTHPFALTLIKRACQNWGMFQAINHGIPIHLLHQIEHQTKKLFELPADRKLLAVRSPDGFAGYGVARISCFFPKQMWYEGFTILGSPHQHASQLWPNHRTVFCEAMEEYQKEVKRVSEKIVGLMFNSLGLTQEDINWFRPEIGCKDNEPQAVLQLNSYPVCPDPDRAMGLPPHTDSSLLTLLHQSDASGFQVLRDGIGWVGVQPVKGALVANVGDLMHIITNGRFKAPLHQALVNSKLHRLSIAYFYGPPKNVKISTPLKLVDFDHPILYRSVSWKDYLDAKATHFNKALNLIKFDSFYEQRM